MNWRVDSTRAFVEWVTQSSPNGAQIDRVAAWIERVIVEGPPNGAFEIGGDLYIAVIEGARTRATYLAIWQDRIVIVKSFG